MKNKNFIGVVVFFIFIFTMLSISVINSQNVRTHTEFKKLYGDNKIFNEMNFYRSPDLIFQRKNTTEYSRDRNIKENRIEVLKSHGSKYYDIKKDVNKKNNLAYYYVDMDGKKFYLNNSYRAGINMNDSNEHELYLYNSSENNYNDVAIKKVFNYKFRYNDMLDVSVIKNKGDDFYIIASNYNTSTVENNKKMIFNEDLYLIHLKLNSDILDIKRIKSYHEERVLSKKEIESFNNKSEKYKVDIYNSSITSYNSEKNYFIIVNIYSGGKLLKRDVIRFDKSNNELHDVKFSNEEAKKYFVGSNSSHDYNSGNYYIANNTKDNNPEIIKFSINNNTIKIDYKKSLDNIFGDKKVFEDKKEKLNLDVYGNIVLSNEKYTCVVFHVDGYINNKNKNRPVNIYSRHFMCIFDNSKLDIKYIGELIKNSDNMINNSNNIIDHISILSK